MSTLHYRGFEIRQNPVNKRFFLYRDGYEESPFPKASLEEAKRSVDRILDAESRTKELDRRYPDIARRES